MNRFKQIYEDMQLIEKEMLEKHSQVIRLFYDIEFNEIFEDITLNDEKIKNCVYEKTISDKVSGSCKTAIKDCTSSKEVLSILPTSYVR